MRTLDYYCQLDKTKPNSTRPNPGYPANFYSIQPNSGGILPGGHTRLAADVLAAVRAPLANHDAAAPPADIPRLAAPAAVPGLVLGLEGAVRERALGERVARGGRVRDGLLGGARAGSAASREARGAVGDVCRDVLAGETEGDLMTHFE